MSFDDFKQRVAENVPGRFYVTDECLDCNMCRELAPSIFSRLDTGGYSYVSGQPVTPEECALAEECVACCCVNAIHNDGDTFDWLTVPAGTGSRAGSVNVIIWPPEVSAITSRFASMKLTRICVGLAVWIFIMGPFLMLGKLSFDIRGCNLLGRFKNVDMELPLPSELFWRFGPVGWWACLTPLALAMTVAAAMRKPWPGPWLAGLLAASVLQFVSLFGGVLIYYKMTSLMGAPAYPIPIPTGNLVANLALLGTSIGLAAWSVARMRKSG